MTDMICVLRFRCPWAGHTSDTGLSMCSSSKHQGRAWLHSADVFVVCVPFRNDMCFEILFKVRASASANHNDDPIMAANELDTGSFGTEHTVQVLGLVF